jgi:hypothetical protein
MARDTITVTNSVRAGVLAALITPVFANQAEVANPNGRVVVIYINGMGAAGVSDTEVTIQQVADPYGRTENDPAFDVTTDTVGVFGPFPPALYNQSDGTVQFDFENAINAGAERVFGLSVL